MSDPKNVSPLLDGFLLGAPICEHHGVICCPAIKENTSKKYIVKIISVPATQAQMDALLLAGAYKDPADAMEYFRKQGEQILAEAEQLKMLSKMEGFLPYDGWQMEPITRRRLGYQVFLVGSYKRSLEKYMAKNAFTHLEAINLCLDLCSALSVCRESGYLYIDLKPSNIYVSENKQYRIGDLGFLNMDSLRYASLPERYHSPYSPPELLDPMTPMHLSVDTYAVGMIMYQLYNDGHLPFSGLAPEQPMPSPVHADYELAEIIMKAIDPIPENRWTDPRELGKAIASYMQRNRVNDIPITPFIPLDVTAETLSESATPKDKDTPPQNDAQDPAQDIETDSGESIGNNATAVVLPREEICQNVDLTDEEVQTTPEEAPLQIIDDNDAAEPETEDTHQTDLIPEDSEKPVPAPIPLASETLKEEAEQQGLSEEVARIIAKADDLITHEIPQDTIYPFADESDPFGFAYEDTEAVEDDLPEDPLIQEESTESIRDKSKKTKHFADTSGKKKIKKFFSNLFALLLLCVIIAGSLWFYQNVYLQTIDKVSVSGTQDQIIVLIDTSVEESLLSVHCTDGKGNQHTEAVKGGKAIFKNLQPSTDYTIEVRISGFHKLSGQTTERFTTDATTQILTFDVIAGSEDGSVKLDFTVDGDEPDFWNIRYSAEGEDEKRETIQNHSTMISGLTVGKVYTFTLDGGKNFDLSGKTSAEYMACKLILAENLNAVTTNGKDITVQWDTPGDVVVENWMIRCYDGYGYDNQVTVTDTKALFTGLDPSSSYVIEVTAAGMTQPVRFDVSADPIHLTNFRTEEKGKTELIVSWEFTGKIPDGGWILNYKVDGSGNQTVECDKASVSITPLVPGATYDFIIQSADGRTVFNNVSAYTTAAAEVFADNGIIPDNLSADLLKTPDDPNWCYEQLQDAVLTKTFAAGDTASVVLQSTTPFYLPGYETKILYIFRNSHGNVLPELIAEETVYWKSIWNHGDPKIGELEIPKLPSIPGSYVVELYFNGKTVAQMDIIITD